MPRRFNKVRAGLEPRSMLDVLAVMRDTREPISLNNGKALLWIEPVSIRVVNELMSLRAVAHRRAEGGAFELAITKVGEALVGDPRIIGEVRGAAATGRNFTIENRQIIWRDLAADDV